MPYLRAFLGVFLVMIALATANQSLSVADFCSDDTSPLDQSDDQSDGQQGDQVNTVEVVVLQKRFFLPVPVQSEKSFSIVPAVSEKAFPAKSFRDVSFLKPARLLLSRSGLLPRAPSLT